MLPGQPKLSQQRTKVSRASFVRFPEQGFATWVLCNMGEIRPSGLGLEVADLFLADDMKR